MSQEQEQKENEALAKLLLGDNPTHEAPAFAAVAQPNYMWSEKAETPGAVQGHTILPTPAECWKNNLEGNASKAEIVFAPGTSPRLGAIKRTLKPEIVKDIFQGRRAQATSPEEMNLIVKYA